MVLRLPHPLQRWLPKRRAEPLAPPVPRELLALEMAQLHPHRRLWRQGDWEVWMFTARQAPALLLEVGRLREVTFRAVQEGTGARYDLDRFDDEYDQLVLWDRAAAQVAGAYRLRRVLSGAAADLYTQNLFHLQPGFFTQVGPAIELGRSFVAPQYQRKPHSLLLLWRGIGAYLERHPECRMLFGAVSVSRSYSDDAIRDMMSLGLPRGEPLRQFVRARRPWTTARTATPAAASDAPRPIPVLLRQYLRLGARVIDWSVDPNFGDCLDALIVVDLLQADQERLGRMLGKGETAHAPAPAGKGLFSRPDCGASAVS
ncbi:MAG: GNAT family N-acetyltransferase [Acidobacteria bacterium]|nr:GNAT family N-acetyltransferase [Acidobacteriota bacterium]